MNRASRAASPRIQALTAITSAAETRPSLRPSVAARPSRISWFRLLALSAPAAMSTSGVFFGRPASAMMALVMRSSPLAVCEWSV